MKIAIIQGGLVENVIVGDIVDYPTGVDLTNVTPQPGIRWTYAAGVFTAPAYVATTITGTQRVTIIGRLTPVEMHAWHRAMSRATATNTPVVADRNALYAWVKWEAMPKDVDLNDSDIQGLKSVWMALGMTQARADAILAPTIQ